MASSKGLRQVGFIWNLSLMIELVDKGSRVVSKSGVGENKYKHRRVMKSNRQSRLSLKPAMSQTTQYARNCWISIIVYKYQYRTNFNIVLFHFSVGPTTRKEINDYAGIYRGWNVYCWQFVCEFGSIKCEHNKKSTSSLSSRGLRFIVVRNMYVGY